MFEFVKTEEWSKYAKVQVLYLGIHNWRVFEFVKLYTYTKPSQILILPTEKVFTK